MRRRRVDHGCGAGELDVLIAPTGREEEQESEKCLHRNATCASQADGYQE